MEKLLQVVMYFCWALWLIYGYALLFGRGEKPGRKLLLVTIIALPVLLILLKSRLMILFSVAALLIILVGILRKPGKKEPGELPNTEPAAHSPVQSFIGMALITVVLVSLFLLLGMDFKADTGYFIEKYDFKIKSQQKEIIIGNSKEVSDITIENESAAGAHVRLTLGLTDFSIRNISRTKKVDLDGRYLNKLALKTGDEIEIMGREKIRLLEINNQYPLGRSIRVAVQAPGQGESRVIALHTFLNKPLIIKYQPVSSVSAGLNKLVLPGRLEKNLAALAYEPNRYFLGVNIYYLVIFFTILLLSLGVYLYLKNRFNGALLLLLFASLPFMAGAVSLFFQLIIILGFLPFIVYIQYKRKPGWNWGATALAVSFAAIFILPLVLRMDGDFTFRHYDFSQEDSIKVTRGTESFQLKDIEKKAAYDQKHVLILGHTAYELLATKTNLSLVPLGPEKIKFSPHYQAIISDLTSVTPGGNYLYLDFPHRFNAIPAAAAAGKERLTVAGINEDSGNSIVLSRVVNENYSAYTNGLIFFILIPFWLFWFVNYFGFSIANKGLSRLGLLNNHNVIIYHFVFFMLGLGYLVFGALALYNNNYLDGFQKYKGSALPLFVGLFFLFLVLSRCNRWVVFLYRVLSRKKFHVPLAAASLLVLLVNYSKIFLYAGVLLFIVVFFIRLRKDLYYEYKNSQGYPLNIKNVVEKIIAGFEDENHRRIFFGLGGILNKKGWNYLIIADLFLLLALFFIVLQIFLGSELGVSMAGFFFLPIELGKILLTLYFADWVSRIDKGMELNVLWIYGLALIPFFLLTAFLIDLSPLLVFSFVFLYHIIKIKKTWEFKLFLAALILVTLVISVTALADYTFPFAYFGIILSVLLLVMLARVWFNKTTGKWAKICFSIILAALLAVINYTAFFHTPAAPKSLGGRIGSWLDPWRDYNLSYQYVNSLWFMKGAGTFGKSTVAFTAAGHVPLIEKDLGFSLYIGVLGTVGAAFIFFTLFLIIAYVHKMNQKYSAAVQSRGSPFSWYLYQLEFLAVIFLAQYIVPALYVVGLLPVMGQSLPFLSYSNNLLLLFALPFSFLMIVLGNNMEESK